MLAPLDKLLRYFHFYVGRVERRLSRPPRDLFGRATQESQFLFHFNDAVEISKSFPEKGTQLLLQLLPREEDADLPPEWIRQRVARVYYHLGMNAQNRQDKLNYWRECLNRMPNHYRCRELYQHLSQQGS